MGKLNQNSHILRYLHKITQILGNVHVLVTNATICQLGQVGYLKKLHACDTLIYTHIIQHMYEQTCYCYSLRKFKVGPPGGAACSLSLICNNDIHIVLLHHLNIFITYFNNKLTDSKTAKSFPIFLPGTTPGPPTSPAPMLVMILP